MLVTFFIIVAGILFLLLFFLALLTYDKATRARVQARVARAEQRAGELVETFGLQRRQDADIATIWHLFGSINGLRVELSVGSPPEHDFLVADVRGRRWLPDGIRVRGAGVMPGYHPKDGIWETADAYAGQHGLVIEPKEAMIKWPFVVTQIEQFPPMAWPLEITPEQFSCRASVSPSAPISAVVLELIATALVWAQRTEAADPAR